MIIDIEAYTASKSIVINYYEGKGGKDARRSISMGASITHCPAVVVAYWIGDHAGWTPEIIQTIKSLIDFYGYTEIQNKPEGSPI